MTRLADLVATSERVGATRARLEKVRELAAFLRTLGPEEIRVGVQYLAGEAPQGRFGIGPAVLRAASDAPAAEAPSLTLTEVDRTLADVAGLRGRGLNSLRAAALRDLFGRATVPEQAFLFRLLLGELRQGALEGVVVDAIAAAAEVPVTEVRRALMYGRAVGPVAEAALTGKGAGLAKFQLEILSPVAPMLAQTAAFAAEALEQLGGEAAFEWKLDGARIQAHKAGATVRIYTRNLNDVTARLPGIVDLARTLPAESFLLDGEAVGVGEDELPQTFQDTMSQFGRQADGAGAGLASRFFDILHLDGDDLIDRPLRNRLATLERLAGPWRIPGIITADPVEAQQVLDEALAAGHEGVMVKDAGSSYEAGRRGGAWRKVKPVHTLDLVVLAVEWGSGRRQGWLSNLHLGARDVEAPGEYVMVGKTFKGLTDELLTWQTERFLELETHRTGHVVFVRPELVVEIALDGVQSSTRYAGGVALRFARVRRYRPDKSPAEADTIEAVRAMFPGRKTQSLPDG
jgi:DNA ligase-1